MSLRFDINLRYADFRLTCDDSIALNGITGILGHSGSGKTSLLRCIAGLNKHTEGYIELAGKTLLDRQKSTPPEQRHIGFVFQDARLFLHLNVLDNLRFAQRRSKSNALSIEHISELTNITALLRRDVEQLSAGEKQRVALARALIAAPKLLLLDEPLSSLDPKSRGQLINLLRDIHQQLALPMIYVSHSLSEIQQLADGVLVMDKGKIIQHGHVHQVLNQLDQSIASEYSLQTSLELTVEQHLYDFGLTQLSLNDNSGNSIDLFANITKQDVGCNARVYILASDVSIALDKSEHSSINNIIKGQISQIRALSNNLVQVSVRVLDYDFQATISRYSLDKLLLTKGLAVYLQFKASAIRCY